jgi:hypothetical protein
MRVKIKSKNLRRLASLSALGAGAMAVVTGTAEADVVEVNVNQSVGFDPGFSSMPVTVSLPGGAGFSLVAMAFTSRGSTLVSQKRRFPGGTYRGRPSWVTSDHFRKSAAFRENLGIVTRGVNLTRNRIGISSVAAFSQGGGRKPSSLAGPLRLGVEATAAASRFFSRTVNFYCTNTFRFGCFATIGPRKGNLVKSLYPENNFPDPYRYFLFNFQDDGQTLYGWGQLNVTVGPGVGPDVTLVDYAYDTTGARIAPGQTSSVPEPSETVPLALSALVLGAAGVRRWRAAKAS